MGDHKGERRRSRYGWVWDLYLVVVTQGLERWYGGHDLHFITCSCYHRQPQLGTADRRDLFLRLLEEARQQLQFVVYGYAVMPEHFHLLMSEPEKGDPSLVMKVVKQRFARLVNQEMGTVTRDMSPTHSQKPRMSGAAARVTLGTRYFNTSARFWMNAQSSYDLEVAQDELQRAIERDVHPLVA